MTKALIILLGLLSALDALSIDAYIPAMPSIESSLHAGPGSVQVTLSVFMIGLGIGQGLWGPILDWAGRRKPLLVGMLIYIMGSALAAVATSVEGLMLARFIQAVGGAAGLVAPRAVLADLCQGQQAARLFTLMMQLTLVGAICAPLMGGLILSFASWRWIFSVLTIIGLFGFVWSWVSLPESQPPASRIRLRLAPIVQGYSHLLKRPRFSLYLLAGTLAMASFFTYLGDAAFVFINEYHLSQSTFTLFFTLNTCCLLMGGVVNNRLLKHGQSAATISVYALSLQVLLAALLVMVVTCFHQVSLAAYLILLPLIIAVQGSISGNLAALTMNEGRHQKGVASSLMGMLQYLVAGAIGYLAAWALPVILQIPVVITLTTLLALGLLITAARRPMD